MSKNIQEKCHNYGGIKRVRTTTAERGILLF